MYDVLIFLYANNFFHYANYLLVVMFLYSIVQKKFAIVRVRTISFIFLLMGSMTYCGLFLRNYDMPETSTFMLRFISPIIMFYMGYVIGLKGIEVLKKEIILIAFAGCLHGLMNVVTNRNLDILSVAGRQYQDIYGGSISGTLQNLFFIASSALLFYFFVCTKTKKLKIIGTLAGLSGILASIVNASRTIIYVTILIFMFSLFVYLLQQYNFETAIARFGIVALVLLFIAVFVMWLDLFHIQELLANSALGRRETTAVATSSVAQNLRWTYAGDILRLLPKYPFGGVEYDHYAHNLWVDIAREAGIIPFILYILFAISAIKEGIVYYRDNSNKIINKIFILSILITYLLVFFTEPIMDGSPISFSLFCFALGGVSALNKMSMRDNPRKKVEKNENCRDQYGRLR